MLTTLDKVKSYLNLDIAPEYASNVQEYIEAVTAHVERYTGRIFSADSAATARYYDGTDSGEMFIDDAVEVTEVKIDGSTVGSSDYRLYPPNRTPKTRIIMPYRRFPEGAQNVAVTARWGYGATVPADLSFAATVMVAGIVNAQNESFSDDVIQSESIGRYQVTYRTPKERNDGDIAQKIIKQYRKYS